MNLFPHVDWSRNASIYEVNVRQYTPEGTLAAMAAHLPLLLQSQGLSLQTEIGVNTALPGAQLQGKVVYESQPDSSGARD